MKHLSWDEILAYIDGDALSPERQGHATSCPICVQTVDSARRADAALERTLLRVAPPPIADGLHDRVVKAINQTALSPEDTGASRVSRTARRGYWKWIGAASGAVALLIVGITVVPSALRPHQAPAKAIAMDSHVATHASNASSSGANSTSQGIMKMSTTVNQGPVQATHPDAQATNKPPLKVNAIGSKQVSGTVSVTVANATGQRVQGANVAFVAGGKVMTTELTTATGQVQRVGLQMPVEPLLSFVKGPHQVGRYLLVVWKTGYRPVIQYGNMLSNDEHSQTTVTLQAGNLNDPPIQILTSAHHAVIDTDLPTRMASAHQSAALIQPGITPRGGTQLTVKVSSPTDKAIAGATVSLLQNGQSVHHVFTNSNGSGVLEAQQSQPDLLQVGPWMQGQTVPRVALLLVSKSGYRSALEIVSYKQGMPVAVSVHLLPLGTSGTQSTAIASNGVMSKTGAEAFYQWVVNQRR